MKFRGLSPEQIAVLQPRPYPNFPEYVLLDVPSTFPVPFRRGASVEHLYLPEAETWERFILDHYNPPESARLLVLHQCSWAKPYDMSATLQPVAQLCARFDFVHRLIVSNVGLVPQELQMNQLFCAYDWAPPDGREPPELTAMFHDQFEKRLSRYLAAHSDQYWGLLALASQEAGSKRGRIRRVAEAAGLPLITVPDTSGWNLTEDCNYRDPGDRIRHPEVLSQMNAQLERVATAWRGLNLL